MSNLINIRTITKYLTAEACKLLVLNTVVCHLDYSNSLFFGLPSGEISRLQRIQNSAAKLVLGFDRYDSPKVALRKLHWLPIANRIEFKIACLVFKCLNGTAPSYLSDMLSVKVTTRSLRSVDSALGAPLLNVPFYKHRTFLDRSFAYSGPTIWNSLPAQIRSSKTINDFRKSLKTYLFKRAFL